MYPKLNGFNTKEVTLYTDSKIKVGSTVMLEANCKAVLPASDAKFCGVCTDARGNYITVALSGFVQLPYTGTAPTVGYNNLACDGNGNAKVSEKGREILVAEVDTTNKTISIIL